MGLQRFEFLGAYARDLLEFVGAGEAAVFGAPVEDALGEYRSDTGQTVELGEGCGIQIDGSVSRCSRRTSWLSCARSTGRHTRRDSDDDLLAVGDLAREVERRQVHPWECSARCRQYVGDP
jgi:hypothetical protein